MAEEIQRSRGVPSNYKQNRGGVPAEFGPFAGVVKNNVDPTRSGRLQVYIEVFSGGDPNDDTKWTTVNYLPSFYGSTPPDLTPGTGVGHLSWQSKQLWHVVYATRYWHHGAVCVCQW